MATQAKNIVYGLIDPRTNQLRYVGLSSVGLKRPNSHTKPYKLYRLDRKSRKFSHCQLWLQNLVKNGFQPEIIVIEEFNTKQEMNEGEKFYISYFKSIGADLTNHQPGGYEGRKGGWKHSPETIEKLKKSAQERYKKDPSSILKAVDSRRGVPMIISEETRRKISIKNKGKPMPEKARIKLIERLELKKIRIKDQFGNVYDSLTEAAAKYNTSTSFISRHLKGKVKSVKGITFTKLENK